MSDLSWHEADRSSRLARAAADCGTSGKLCPAERGDPVARSDRQARRPRGDRGPPAACARAVSSSPSRDNKKTIHSRRMIKGRDIMMHILNIVTSPRKDQSASRALVEAFLREYMTQADDIVVDTLDVWQEWLREFDAETINAKYKGVSGEPMTPAEATAWKKIRELASRFQRADRIVMGVPMWNFSFPYKLKQLIDLSCQRNMLFRFDGKRYGPSLDIEKAFVAFVRGQSDEAGFETVPQPGFQYLSGYIEFWLRFIGVREVATLTLEHTWDGRAVDMIDAGKKKAAELARQF